MMNLQSFMRPPNQQPQMRSLSLGEMDAGGGYGMPGRSLRSLFQPMPGGQMPPQQASPMTGGNIPAQPFNPQAAPQFNGQFPQGSYGMNAQGAPHGGSNGGINPGGMYGASSVGFGQPTYPAGLAQLFSSYRFR